MSATAAHARRRARDPRRGHRAGRRLPAVRLPAGARARARRLRAQRRARGADRGRGGRAPWRGSSHGWRSEAPPLAVLERIASDELRPTGERGFQILASPRGEAADAPVTPDTATCADCLRELLDPADRRFRYPFINCTNCGPRFTIVRGVPYDRPLTTMAAFRMCSACQAEYDDPDDRRFHAQPNACPRCGPAVTAARRRRCWGRSRRRPRRRARRPLARSPAARSSRSRGSAAITWRAAPTTRRPSRGCARASTARTGRSR